MTKIAQSNYYFEENLKYLGCWLLNIYIYTYVYTYVYIYIYIGI